MIFPMTGVCAYYLSIMLQEESRGRNAPLRRPVVGSLQSTVPGSADCIECRRFIKLFSLHRVISIIEFSKAVWCFTGSCAVSVGLKANTINGTIHLWYPKDLIDFDSPRFGISRLTVNVEDL